jgi:hypothetical protein
MELHKLLKILVEAFESLNIPYIVTGSVASIFYGEPRFTNDIDVVADLKKEDVGGFLKFFPKDQFYVSESVVMDAIQRRFQFNIIHPASGAKIDIIIKKQNDFDKSRFQRRKKVSPAEDIEAAFASCEDVVIMKMEYYREGGSEKHIRDITGMLKLCGKSIDYPYITQWAERLGLAEIWRKIVTVY